MVCQEGLASDYQVLFPRRLQHSWWGSLTVAVPRPESSSRDRRPENQFSQPGGDSAITLLTGGEICIL